MRNTVLMVVPHNLRNGTTRKYRLYRGEYDGARFSSEKPLSASATILTHTISKMTTIGLWPTISIPAKAHIAPAP